MENLAVAVHAVNRAQMQSGERVGSIGAGPIGLATATVLRQGGFDADVSARHDHRRPRLYRLGPTSG